MDGHTAELLVATVGAYVVIGAVFAMFFLWRWVGKLDSAARHGTWGFRLLVFPGVTALWPLLAARLLTGATAPLEEWTAHRRAARRNPTRPRVEGLP